MVNTVAALPKTHITTAVFRAKPLIKLYYIARHTSQPVKVTLMI